MNSSAKHKRPLNEDRGHPLKGIPIESFRSIAEIKGDKKFPIVVSQRVWERANGMYPNRTAKDIAAFFKYSPQAMMVELAPTGILTGIRRRRTEFSNMFGVDLKDATSGSNFRDAYEANKDRTEITIMTDRKFELTKELVNGVYRSGVKIVCSKRAGPDCIKEATFFNSSGSTNHTHAQTQFRHRGWFVGNRAQNDICPVCMKGLRGERSYVEKRPAPPVETTLVKNTPPKADVPLPTIKTDGPPLKVSPADRRIISAKMDEVYDDTQGMYRPGWNDRKVADDLGVAIETVAKVRDDFYGPAYSMDDAKADVKIIKEAMASIASHRTALASLNTKMDEITAAWDARWEKFEEERAKINALMTAFQNKYGGST